MKLNLGSGQRPQDGYINVDRIPLLKGQDVEHDLDVVPWPFPDNSCDEIMASHVLEHLGQNPKVFNNIMCEIYRILRPEMPLIVKVPHHHSEGYFGDPTHVRPLTPQLMSLYSKKHCQRCRDNNWPNTPLADYLNIDLELRTTHFNLTPRWGEKYKSGNILQAELDYAIETFNNVVDEVVMILCKIA